MGAKIAPRVINTRKMMPKVAALKRREKRAA
jgi:hypothetical protein